MRKQILYFFILIFPFVVMIIINECVRLNTTDAGYNKQGSLAINSGKAFIEKCSWLCHNNTEHCKVHHVKWLKPYFDVVDPLYFGIINTFKLTGEYNLANILILGVFVPLILFFLLVKSIDIQFKIRDIKQAH